MIISLALFGLYQMASTTFYDGVNMALVACFCVVAVLGAPNFLFFYLYTLSSWSVSNGFELSFTMLLFAGLVYPLFMGAHNLMLNRKKDE